MPKNSHNASVDETPKPFSNQVTAESYDLAVLTRREFCDKWGISTKQYDKMQKVRNG
jgi:hypothetical protein